VVRARRFSLLWLLAPTLALAIATGCAPLRAQQLSELDRARGRVMLRLVREDLEGYYYDTTYRGMKLAERFDSADRRITAATSNGEVFGVIAQVLADLDDSHTWFIPPLRAGRVIYGWELMAVGDSVYIAAVKPGSDAEAQGLHPGDRVLMVNNVEPTRQNLFKMRYLFEILRPQVALRLSVENPEGARRELTIQAEVRTGRARLDVSNEDDLRQLYLEFTDAMNRRHEVREFELGDILIWRLNSFEMPPSDIDKRMRKAAHFRALILDLRGNPGGYAVTLQQMVSHLVDRDVLISVGRARGHVDSVRASPSRSPFTGRLIVLVDSRSASAAEILARTLQIEERATVLGDWTSGAVEESIFVPHAAGTGRLVFFGTSVTVHGLVMSDGHGLEGRGMMPDEELRPGPTDLAAGRDPVLARAVQIAGGALTPEQAGRLFPFE
jgi:C-terminal processing protease CtpA/Prc